MICQQKVQFKKKMVHEGQDQVIAQNNCLFPIQTFHRPSIKLVGSYIYICIHIYTCIVQKYKIYNIFLVISCKCPSTMIPLRLSCLRTTRTRLRTRTCEDLCRVHSSPRTNVFVFANMFGFEKDDRVSNSCSCSTDILVCYNIKIKLAYTMIFITIYIYIFVLSIYTYICRLI